MSSGVARLSKSRFCYGLQCLRQLWWRVHEPDAPELVPPPSLEVVFARGHLVGERARAEFRGGMVIGHDHWEVEKKVADTRAALDREVPAVFEASFLEDGVFVAVDALERRKRGHALVEVKSSTKVKEQYIPDVAIQLHVLRKAGVRVVRAEVMHLNSACRFPRLEDLFVREDVTREAEALLPSIPGHLRRIRRALAGDLPEVEPGDHCDTPYPCPFVGRCSIPVPEDHVSTLFRLGRRLAQALVDAEVESLRDIPDDVELSAIQARQVSAARSGKVVVGRGLARALGRLRGPIAYLDFESVNPAIPVWDGCGPYMAVPVQMSCHVVGRVGAVVHHEHLAEGPGDPRPALAEAVVGACRGAETVVAYNASFERRCLEHLAGHVPAHRKALEAIQGRLEDLHPIVRDHVYHPRFGGSFGLKAVAPALVRGLDYGSLEIGEGSTASAVLEGLLLDGAGLSERERQRLRRQLLDYCERDTMAMVKVVERLERLGASAGG